MGRYLAFLGLPILCCALTGPTAANEPTLGISIVAAGQEGPVEIVGFKPLPEDTVNLALHVRNVSNKAKVDYWVEPLIRNAQDRLWNYSNGHAANYPENGKIPPGGEVWETNPAAPGVLWATVAKDLNSTCLRMTGVVIEVKFADGYGLTPMRSRVLLRCGIGSRPATAASSISSQSRTLRRRARRQLT